MNTTRLYDKNPYDKTFQAEVLAISIENERIAIILDQTLFFPEEGGQTSDRGFLMSAGDSDSCDSDSYNSGSCNIASDRAIEIFDVQIKDGLIRHYCQPVGEDLDTCLDRIESLIPVGSMITGQIDWNHRYDNMQNHTGEHIYSGLVHSTYGYNNVGFHLSDHIVTMDYDGKLTIEQALALEERANEIIYQNLPVEIHFPETTELAKLEYRSKLDLTEDVRIVTIPGVDVCACCAPHLASTGEVGLLKVLNLSNYKGGVRLTIACGKRALLDYDRKQVLLDRICQELNANIDTLEDALHKKEMQLDAMKAEISALNDRLLSFQLAEIDPASANVLLFVHQVDSKKLRDTINELMEAHTGFVAIFDGSDDSAYRYIIGSKSCDCTKISTALNQALSAKGGGQKSMIQGSVTSSEKVIRDFFESSSQLY